MTDGEDEDVPQVITHTYTCTFTHTITHTLTHRMLLLVRYLYIQFIPNMYTNVHTIACVSTWTALNFLQIPLEEMLDSLNINDAEMAAERPLDFSVTQSLTHTVTLSVHMITHFLRLLNAVAFPFHICSHITHTQSHTHTHSCFVTFLKSF